MSDFLFSCHLNVYTCASVCVKMRERKIKSQSEVCLFANHMKSRQSFPLNWMLNFTDREREQPKQRQESFGHRTGKVFAELGIVSQKRCQHSYTYSSGNVHTHTHAHTWTYTLVSFPSSSTDQQLAGQSVWRYPTTLQQRTWQSSSLPLHC